MKQQGTVIKTDGRRATVRFVKSGACGNCNACFRFGGNEADIEMANPLNAKEGQRVYIEMHARSVLKASIVVYGIPIICLIAGVAAGSLISEVYGAIGGVLLCAGSYFILRGLEPKFAKMNEFKPRMTGFVEDEEMENTAKAE